MKASEFYEKYWKIADGKGGFIDPPSLSEKEKEFLDKSVEDKEMQFAMFYRTRRRPTQINLDYLREDMNKLPKIFYPANQPKLDKWGNIITENHEP